MKKFAYILLVLLLFYTRFVNLGWGLPYPMHPDERNMAVAVQGLNCNFKFEIFNLKLNDCLNPHFFAYGQLPLYLAFGGIQLYHTVNGITGQPTFLEATIALRIISSFSSILLVFLLLKIVELIYQQNKLHPKPYTLLTLLFLIFQPYAIQFAHFGTTESLLMLFHLVILYYSLLLLRTTNYALRTIVLLGLFSGLALGTKTSSILFLGVPLVVIIIKLLAGGRIEGAQQRAQTATPIRHLARLEHWWEAFNSDRICQSIIKLLFYLFITSFFFIFSSPHSFLNWNDFMSSMNYESAVGLGTYIPFYTRQFVGTIPLVFQFTNILPYVLGWPQMILSILGFIFLPWFTNKKQVAELKGPNSAHKPPRRLGFWRVLSTGGKFSILTESVVLNPYNILRIALLLSFLPPSFFFAKWTRFIAPAFPLFSLFSMLALFWIFQKVSSFKFQVTKYIILIIVILPGFAFLSIYTSPDVRFTASEWMYKNIPANSKILSETANVIDLPISTPRSLPPPPYQINSFNFYDLDAVPQLQLDLSDALKTADYIIVPSRRVFANHTCMNQKSEDLKVKKSKSDRCKSLVASYQLLSTYYSELFSGASGFEQVAEFSSYPRIEFSVLGSKFHVPFADEYAEETWTVFDHPVIRIYKRSPKSESQKVLKLQSKLQTNLDFSDYKTMNYALLTTHYKLLLADTPEKWERGLMYVKNKQDIGGLDGMIFTFPDTGEKTFWNMNTLSHLTLYWIQNGAVIGTSDLPSISETGSVFTVSSPSAADTVIEVIDEK